MANGAAGKIGKVRRAEALDVPVLVLLNSQVQELHASLYPADFKACPSSAELTSFFSKLLDREQHFIGICEGLEGAVGYIWFEEVERSGSPFMKPSRLLHIHHIAVMSDARGEGVGSALMKWVDQHARTSGISEVTAEHWAENEDARRFFGGHGFEQLRIIMRRSVPMSD